MGLGVGSRQLNIGWYQVTAVGHVTIYLSQQGRYFRDPVSARSRESTIRRKQIRRGCGPLRREAGVLYWKHLDGPNIAVRICRGDFSEAS